MIKLMMAITGVFAIVFGSIDTKLFASLVIIYLIIEMGQDIEGSP